MARWICFCLIVLTILFQEISMRSLPNPHLISRRHLGSALAKLSRPKSNSPTQDNVFHRTHEALPSPELLRSRWLELLTEQQNQNKDEQYLFDNWKKIFYLIIWIKQNWWSISSQFHICLTKFGYLRGKGFPNIEKLFSKREKPKAFKRLNRKCSILPPMREYTEYFLNHSEYKQMLLDWRRLIAFQFEYISKHDYFVFQ